MQRYIVEALSGCHDNAHAFTARVDGEGVAEMPILNDPKRMHRENGKFGWISAFVDSNCSFGVGCDL